MGNRIADREMLKVDNKLNCHGQGDGRITGTTVS